jgi:hypothetical protein
VEFLGDGGAADDVAAFADRYLEAGAGEIEGADEAVMAAAYDDCVTRHGGSRKEECSFLKKRTKKLLFPGRGQPLSGPWKGHKSLLLLFFRKEVLAFLFL